MLFLFALKISVLLQRHIDASLNLTEVQKIEAWVNADPEKADADPFVDDTRLMGLRFFRRVPHGMPVRLTKGQHYSGFVYSS